MKIKSTNIRLCPLCAKTYNADFISKSHCGTLICGSCEQDLKHLDLPNRLKPWVIEQHDLVFIAYKTEKAKEELLNAIQTYPRYNGLFQACYKGNQDIIMIQKQTLQALFIELRKDLNKRALHHED